MSFKNVIKGLLIGVTGMILMGCGNIVVKNGDAETTYFQGASNQTKDSAAVTIIVGSHTGANVISPNAATISNKINDVTYSAGRISLIRCDGKPELFFTATIPEIGSGLSKSKRDSIATGYKNDIMNVLASGGAATHEEVNTLEAIRLGAADLGSVDDSYDKHLVIAETGLETTGYLNFTDDTLFTADTEEIISQLKEKKAVPNLEGVHVTWLYLGQTAAPQEALSEEKRDKLLQVYSALLEESGAESYEFLTDVATAVPYEGLPYVTNVEPGEKEIHVTPLTAMVLDSSSVEFHGDKADFVDENKATQAIREVADVLKNNPENVVYVAGTTASAVARTEEFCDDLSYARANAVAKVLEDCGVTKSQMIVVGEGAHAPWRENDIGEDGNLVEEVAKKNRAVWIIDKQDALYGSYLNDTTVLTAHN